MLNKSQLGLRGLSTAPEVIGLNNLDVKKCRSIANLVIIQCITVYIGSLTILHCVWNPYNASLDYDKLARIMYLYDSQACETMHIEASVAVHILWMVSAIVMLIFVTRSRRHNTLKSVLAIFFYVSIFVIIFDISMGIVYIAHIQQSLTKGMIIRYSGWSVDMKVTNHDDFAGWLPIMASVCWMRGIFFLALNIFMCKMVYHVRKKIKTREFRQRMMHTTNLPIPEANSIQLLDDGVLHFRTGEFKPYVKKDVTHTFF